MGRQILAFGFDDEAKRSRAYGLSASTLALEWEIDLEGPGVITPPLFDFESGFFTFCDQKKLLHLKENRSNSNETHRLQRGLGEWRLSSKGATGSPMFYGGSCWLARKVWGLFDRSQLVIASFEEDDPEATWKDLYVERVSQLPYRMVRLQPIEICRGHFLFTFGKQLVSLRLPEASVVTMVEMPDQPDQPPQVLGGELCLNAGFQLIFFPVRPFGRP